MRSHLPAHFRSPAMLSSRFARAVFGGSTALILTVALVAIPAGSRAGLDSVRPMQGFQGDVNYSSVSGAVVTVICPRANQQVGTVKAGSLVDVYTDSTAGGPRTGATDTAITEFFEVLVNGQARYFDPTALPAPDAFTGTAPRETITITEYGTQYAKPIPTSFHAPCGGSGTAVFQPGPGSGGIADRVAIHFTGVAS